MAPSKKTQKKGDGQIKEAAPLTKENGAEAELSQQEREALRVFAIASDNHRRGRMDDAMRGYARALTLNPSIPDVYNNLGVALRSQGKLEAAVACYRRSLALRGNNPGVYSNMGNALREMGRMDVALASHQQAVKMAPKSPEAVYNLGLVLRDLGKPDQALKCFDKSLSFRDSYVDCHWDKSLCLLQLGNLVDGFKEYEWRWKLDRNQPRKYDKPLWDGFDLKGQTILVHHEQGFGDMIQFVRYVPILKEMGARVLVECQPELIRLFSTVDGIDKVIMRGSPLPPFDTYIPMLSIPRVLQTTLETVPATVPYLKAPAHGNLTLPQDGTLKIGIAWAGKPSHKNDRNRSADLRPFVDMMGLPGATFYSLQKGPRQADIQDYACEALITDLGNRFEDFADTAAVVSQLDLVITVDTAVAHLAGALNIPVWVMIPFNSDWRWLIGRNDSPWYPSMRLFRQERPGTWDHIFFEIRKALQEKLAEA